jgi:hypothetical protein
MWMSGILTRDESIIREDKRKGIHDRVLQPLALYNKRVEVLGYDVETYNNNKGYLLGSVVGKNYRKILYSREEAQHFFETNNYIRHKPIFTTNLTFDFLATYPERQHDPSKIILIRPNTNVICATVAQDKTYNGKPNNKASFYDTLSYSPSSVEELGKVVGVEKMKSPSFLGRRYRNPTEREELESYNINDSTITYLFAQRLADFAFVNKFKLKATVASSSMDFYRRRFMDRPFLKPLEQQPFRDSYYGGRSEMFSRGLMHNMKMGDVCSMYPFCMTKEFPDTWSLHKEVKGTKDNLDNFGVSYVQMTAPYMYYPVLPMRLFRPEKKLVFPIGNIKGTYTHEEINKAIALGYTLKSIGRQTYYSKSFFPFRDFINNLYKERMKAKDPVIKLMYKLYMNSLYGKWGQDKIKQKTFIPREFATTQQLRDYNPGSEMTFCTNNAKELEEMMENAERFITVNHESDFPKFSNPIYSVYTTAYARLHLHSLLVRYKGVYTDTDSILTREHIEGSNRLGELKLEEEGDVIVVKPKTYKFFGGRCKAKGFSLRHIDDDKESKENKWDRLMKTGKIEQKKFLKLGEAVRTGRYANEVIDLMKHITFNDDKRVWHEPFTADRCDVSEPLEL